MTLLNIGCGHTYHKDWINLDLYKSKFVQYYNIKNRLPFAQESVDAIYHSHVLEHLDKSSAKKFILNCYQVLKPGGIIRIAVPDLEKICIEYLKNLNKGYAFNDQKSILDYKWNKIEMFDQIVRRHSGGEMLSTIQNKNYNRDYILYRNGEEASRLLDLVDEQQGLSLKQKIIKLIRKNHFLFGLLALFIKRFNPQKSGEAHRWMYDRLDLKIILEDVGFRSYKIVEYNESKILNWDKYNLDKAQGGDYPRKPDSLIIEAIK